MLEAAGDPTAPSKSRSRRRRKGGGIPTGYRVAEVYFERRGGRSIVGNIYKGRVDNVLPGSRGRLRRHRPRQERLPARRRDRAPGRRDHAPRPRQGVGPRITDLLRPGQEIVVQVVKDPLKTKGARLSMELTIAGRYMVYAPTGEGVGVSRRLEDKERDRLRKEAKQLDLDGGGAIIRTAAHGATRADFERELQYLFKLNEVLEKRVEETTAPALVFQEADLSVRVVRDIFSEHFERAIVDDEQQHHRLVSFFSRTAPELVDRVELWEDAEAPLFEAYGVDPVIDGMLSAPRRPAERRLPDDRLRRGADRHRRQHRLVHRQGQVGAARGHDHQDEPRGRRGGRPPAAAARHRRDHRHRLHRHGARAQPRRGAQDAAQGARRGPHEDLRGRDLAARAGRDDAPERHRRRARDHDQAVPDLRRRGRRASPRRRSRSRSSASCATLVAEAGDGGPEAYLVRLNPRVTHLLHRRRRAHAARARGRRPAATSTSRAPRACRWTTSRSRWRARARRSRSRPSRSAPARRSTSTSSSRTCTTRTTRWPRSTAT